MKRITKIIFLFLMFLVVGFSFIVKPKALEYVGDLPFGYYDFDFQSDSLYAPFGIYWDRLILFNDNDSYYLDLWASNPYHINTVFNPPHEDDYTSKNVVKLLTFKDSFNDPFYIFTVSYNQGLALYVYMAIGYLDSNDNYVSSTSTVIYNYIWYHDGPFSGQMPDEFYGGGLTYEMPYNSKFVNNAITQRAEYLFYVKELHNSSYWVGFEDGKNWGLESAKEEYGLYINGVFYSGQDLYNYAYNKGLTNTESSSGIGVLVSGFFSAIAMFGDIEILPGLKIFYIIGFFLIIGLVMFLFKVRGSK